jgi:hypothetical protein
MPKGRLLLGGLGDLVALDGQEQVDQLLAEQLAQDRVLLQFSSPL